MTLPYLLNRRSGSLERGYVKSEKTGKDVLFFAMQAARQRGRLRTIAN
jgi:hypothetical protein